MVWQETLLILLSSLHYNSSDFLPLCSSVTNICLVDGGHRAIKYTRIGGVGKEIYQEGRFGLLNVLPSLKLKSTRNAFSDPVAGNAH